MESYFKLFHTILVLTNKFAIWVDIQLKCNIWSDGLINYQSSIHVLTQILLEVSNKRLLELIFNQVIPIQSPIQEKLRLKISR